MPPKNSNHYAKLHETSQSHKKVVLFEMSPVKTRVLHRCRDAVRGEAVILFGRKRVMRKYFESVLLGSENNFSDCNDCHGDGDNINNNNKIKQFIKAITANTFLLFTNTVNPFPIIEKLQRLSNPTANKILPKGIITVNGLPISLILKKDLLKANLDVIEKNNQLVLERDTHLDSVVHRRAIKLLRMDEGVAITATYVLAGGTVSAVKK